MTVGPCERCDAPAVVKDRWCLTHARVVANEWKRRRRPRTGVCKIVGCEETHHARRMCSAHYARWRRYGDPHTVLGRGHRSDLDPDLGRTHPECTVEGCDGEHYGRGWCAKHWMRWWKHGDPNHVAPSGPPAVREGCRVDGCGGEHEARGLCSRHYQRWYAGDPDLRGVALPKVSA